MGGDLAIERAGAEVVDQRAGLINGQGAHGQGKGHEAGASGQTGALANVSSTNNYGGLLTLAGATTISSDSGTLNLTNTGTITIGAGRAFTTTSTAFTNSGGTLTGTGTLAFAAIWLAQCLGVWWDRRTIQRLMRLDDRARLRLADELKGILKQEALTL